MKVITVLVAEDHAVVREGLKSLLQLCPDFNVVGEAANGNQAVALAGQLQPDVIVMDIAMPQLNGFEATRQIKVCAPKSKVLILSAHCDDEYVDHVSELGASGYVMKQSTGQVLLHAVREVAAGRPYYSQPIQHRMAASQRRAREMGKPAGTPRRSLTSREAQVLQLVAEGAANKQIAVQLGISIKTVEKHRQQLMDKLNIHDTAGLTRHAIAAGIIESSAQTTT
jgi:DNA-binding NarL/FixJ family response regulator